MGTPGRVLSLLEKGTIPGRFLKILVIDEADKMLDGFLDSLKEIFTRVPNDIQIVLASATMPK